MCGSHVAHKAARRYTTHPGESNGKMLIVGMTEGDVRDSIVDGESGILATANPSFKPTHLAGKLRLVWPNGFTAYLRTGKNPEKIRSLNVSLAWFDEFAHYEYPERVWNNARFAMRKGDHPESIITTTPLPLRILVDIMNTPTTNVIRGTMYDNAANLNAEFVEELREELGDTELGRQELEGEVLDLSEWALWKREMYRRIDWEELPELVEIVIGVDPAGGTKGKKNDETGIVGAGIDADDNLYLLGDRSTKKGSEHWPAIAVRFALEMRKKCRKVRIVGEDNYGGDMVVTCIKSCDEYRAARGRIRVESVTATLSKGERAEPVCQRYKLGRAFHVGPFRHWVPLEHQQCSFEPARPRKEQKSPDRMDAAVHACSALMGDGGKPKKGMRGLAKARKAAAARKAGAARRAA